jgi:RNA polymerase sigma-70 factor (ECF subfamily)
MELERKVKEKTDMVSRCDFEEGLGQETDRSARKKNDQALVELLRNRDPDGMKRIIQKYHVRLFSVANGICRNPADTEEVLQEVYWKAWEKIDHFEERSTLGTWMHRITVNTALMKVRKDRRESRNVSLEEVREFSHEDLTLFGLGEWAQSQEDTLSAQEVYDKMGASLENLSPLYQKTFLLRDMLGFSVQETSEMICTTPAAVKSRLHRGRSLIRKACEAILAEN